MNKPVNTSKTETTTAAQSIIDELSTNAPLAYRLRPEQLDDVIGQNHLIGNDKPLRRLLESGRVHSMIFWGPSGSGKTTLAQMMAKYVEAEFLPVSAVQSGVKEIREAIAVAQHNLARDKKTIVFVDEVHRFNKAQQDAFLPYIEDATIIFVGATTENPSFELNRALLSRCRVFTLKPIDDSSLSGILAKGIAALKLTRPNLDVGKRVEDLIVEQAQGDARRLLNLLELSVDSMDESLNELSSEQVLAAAGVPLQNFDKGGDQFYQQISAFHKSIRGSNPDAGLYWLARMLLAGCDPFYLARRLTVIASEDIGNADPRALTVAIDAWDALKRLGQPEGELALAQATTYLASAPKSNASYKAYKLARMDAQKTPSAEVPVHLRNAVTDLQKNMGYKQDYHYAHDHSQGYSPGQRYFPDSMDESKYYQPVERGLESKIAARLDYLRQLDEKQNKG